MSKTPGKVPKKKKKLEERTMATIVPEVVVERKEGELDPRRPRAFMRTKSGAPAKISHEMIEAIANAMRAGQYVEMSAALAGISKQTLYTWIKEGRRRRDAGDEHNLFTELLDAVEKAQAEGATRDLLVIDQASQGQKAEYLKYEQDEEDPESGFIHKKGTLVRDSKGNPIQLQPAQAPQWTASAWRLERKFPKLFGRHDSLNLMPGEPGSDDRTEIKERTPEEMQTRLAELIKKAKGQS